MGVGRGQGGSATVTDKETRRRRPSMFEGKERENRQNAALADKGAKCLRNREGHQQGGDLITEDYYERRGRDAVRKACDHDVAQSVAKKG